MEQIPVDKDGKPVADGEAPANTIYRFVLKNDLKFSNGSPLTMKDVLFNFYVYLDPSYYGSSTVYSTDIVGLQEYRTQSTNVKEQESFNQQFDELATNRIQRFLDCLEVVYEENEGTSLTESTMQTELKKVVQDAVENYGEVAERL